jgi:hypothetical protein
MTRKREEPQIIRHLINLGHAFVRSLLDLVRSRANSSTCSPAVTVPSGGHRLKKEKVEISRDLQ